MDKSKRKILSGMIALTLISGIYMPAYAAAAESIKDTKTIERSEKEALPFTERVKRIIDEMYADQKQKKRQISNENVAGTKIQANTGTEKVPVQVDSPEASIIHDVPERSANPQLAEGTYNFDWRGTPLTQSLYSVAKIANKGVVVNGSLSGQVFLSLNNVSCNQALDYLSSAFNFNWMVDENNGTIIISTSEIMKQSKVFSVNYIDKDKLKQEIVALGVPENNIYANSETGTVSVTGTPYQLQVAERQIKTLDHPVAQCLLVAQLIEISHGKSVDLGMQYSLPTYSHRGGDGTSSTLKGNFLEKLTFSASSSASKELAKGKVIARPMLMVKNGEEGVAAFGDQVPILSETATTASTSVTVEYKDIGTNLKIKPTINANTGDIALQIEAEVSNISRWMTSGQTTAPQISTRKTTTSAHLKSGQSFVIGGLMSVNELDNLSGIPGLMDLPILGKLFSYHSKEKTYAEVYIMITPYLVSDELDPKEVLRRVENE